MNKITEFIVGYDERNNVVIRVNGFELRTPPDNAKRLIRALRYSIDSLIFGPPSEMDPDDVAAIGSLTGAFVTYEGTEIVIQIGGQLEVRTSTTNAESLIAALAEAIFTLAKRKAAQN